MKKKLAALDIRIQFGAIAFAAAVCRVRRAHAGGRAARREGCQVAAEQLTPCSSQIYKRRAELKKAPRPPTIETADLFRLARAMPDRTDMPGIILTLSDLARSSGIKLRPDRAGRRRRNASGSYQTDRIHLLFNGDFYGLSDFLYRLRSLVTVHDGKLEASGRLFNADTVTFNVPDDSFPKISAELFVNAYVYGAAAPPPAARRRPTADDDRADHDRPPPRPTPARRRRRHSGRGDTVTMATKKKHRPG